jgi:hypothetical protein
MKKFIKLFSVIAIFLLNSCGAAVTERLWERSSSTDRVENFFVDYGKKRVVLIGVGKFDDTNDHYHYSITDKSGNLFKVFEIGLKSESGILASFYGSTTRGSKVDKVWIAFGMKNLPKEDKKFLDELNESEGEKIGDFGFYLPKNSIGEIVRYPSSKEKFKNICSETNKDPNCSPIIKLGRAWQGRIRNGETIQSFFGKLVITPFTIAADILLSPLYATIYLMENSPHHSQSSE